MLTRHALVLLAASGLFAGCATYKTPGGRADFSAFAPPGIRESFEAVPAAVLPAHLACVRVQGPRYRSFHTDTEGGLHGSGRYSVVTVREVEEDADLQRIAGLPRVGGVISLSRLLLPPRLESDRELREAAARLKADMLVLYTFDTSFHENDRAVALSAVTLGILPTRRVSVKVTASALIIDTRTGFVYSAIETTERRDLHTNAWESRQSADRARQEAEKAAFKKLVDEFATAWPAIADRTQQGA